MGTSVRLHRLGRHRGADDLEMSCGVMDVLQDGGITYRLVIDCGLHPNHDAKRGEQGWLAPSLDLFADGKRIDAVLITHGHTDHVGYVPALMPFMAPDAKCWATRPTCAILRRGFKDGMAVSVNRGSEPPFTLYQMEECLGRLESFDRPGAGEILPGLETLVHPAGHINGAASFTFKVGDAIIHYAGDHCAHNQPGVRGAPELPPEWRDRRFKFVIAGSDCTYGADHESDGRDWETEMARGADLVAATLRKGSIALVHGFGIHRGPAVAHELRRRGITNIGSVALDGSCRYYARAQQAPDGTWCNLDQAFNLRDIMPIEYGDRETLAAGERPALAVVTTHGMGGPGGPSTFWRRHVLGDPDAAVVFSGYLAPGTDGHKIMAAAAERKRTGKPVDISFQVEDELTHAPRIETFRLECQVEQIRIGSHDSRQDILRWFRSLSPEVAVLSHGSPNALASLAHDLSDIPQVVRADQQGTVDIDC